MSSVSDAAKLDAADTATDDARLEADVKLEVADSTSGEPTDSASALPEEFFLPSTTEPRAEASVRFVREVENAQKQPLTPLSPTSVQLPASPMASDRVLNTMSEAARAIQDAINAEKAKVDSLV